MKVVRASWAMKTGLQGWDPAIARRSMDQALTTLNNDVQGVVSSNDGNAGAAIAAMEEQGMAGTVPVSGLDCTVQAQQLMLLGKQTQCGWRPLEDMAAAAAQVTVRLRTARTSLILHRKPSRTVWVHRSPIVPVGVILGRWC